VPFHLGYIYKIEFLILDCLVLIGWFFLFPYPGERKGKGNAKIMRLSCLVKPRKEKTSINN
jgi:hypothetical protein